MRKLATTLYSANRELKAVLRNSPYGVTYDYLASTPARTSLLEPDELEALIKYTIESDTVVAFSRDGDNYLILTTFADTDEQTAALNANEIIYNPRAPKTPAIEDKHSKSERAPTIHKNHKLPERVDMKRFMPELKKIPESFRLEAIEVMAMVEDRKFGATRSELIKLVPSFDYLEPEQQNMLLETIDRTSVNYAYVDGFDLPTRGTHAYVLVHRNFLSKLPADYTPTQLEVESPLAAQLAALKDKLVLAPERPVEPPKETAVQTPANTQNVQTQHVVGSRISRANPMLTPGQSRSSASQPTSKPDTKAYLDVPATKIPTPITMPSGRKVVMKPADFIAGVNSTSEPTLATVEEAQAPDAHTQTVADITPEVKPDLKALLEAQGECLARIAMQQAQIAVAQLSINNANIAITEDSLKLSALTEELTKYVQQSKM